MEIFFFLIQALTLLINILTEHFFIASLFWLFIFLLIFKKNYSKANAFLAYKTGMIILDGLFNAWKTRLMTTLAKERKARQTFVLSNFWNWYTNIFWSSLLDLQNLLEDLLLLWEFQNFTDEDIKRMYMPMKNNIYKEKMEIRKNIKKQYKNIPFDWYFCNFLILWDEFQNYFYNREAMRNFTGDKKRFLTLLHQVRHFNSLLIFWTQNASELDVKFRKLSSLYVNTFEKLNNLIYWYNVYSFTIDRDNNLDIDKAKKYNKVPIFKLNKYALNNFIWKYLLFVNRLNYFHDKINTLFKKDIFWKRNINFRFDALKFHTKFNVNPEYSIYTKWDLFKYLDNYFKTEKLAYKMIWYN